MAMLMLRAEDLWGYADPPSCLAMHQPMPKAL